MEDRTPTTPAPCGLNAGGCLLRRVRGSRHFRQWLWAIGSIGAALLAACAAGPAARAVPYQPFEGADAARLRLRLVYPADYWPSLTRAHREVTVSAASRSVAGDASCGEVVAFGTLRMFSRHAALAAQPPQTTGLTPTALPQYPRAGMVGSPEAESSEAVELKLAPGRRIVELVTVRRMTAGSTLTDSCRHAVAVQLAPQGQYEFVVGFNSSGRCELRARQLQGATFAAMPVVPYGDLREVCRL
ncbi:MAG: hypothetical protein JNJ89_11600 [Rubrivivax sp.]|nr:hypothetical protein [Rubrivivax sp.]